MTPVADQPRGLSRSSRLTGIAAAVAAISSVGIALGLGLPLLSLVMESRGVSGAAIGINTAMAGISAMAVTPFVTPLARRIGAAQLLAIVIVITAASFPLFFVFDSMLAWFVLRIVFHGAVTAAFILSEFWINALAPENRRGLIMGIYATVLSFGFALGPVILSFTDATTAMPFIAGAAILLLSVVPVLFALKANPSLEGQSQRGFVRFIVLVPMATFAALAFGATESGMMAFIAIYGLRIGLDFQSAALLVSAVAIGNIVLQIPLGMLADRLDRRYMLLACAAGGGAIIAATPLIAHLPWVLFPALMLCGGLLAGLYTIGLTHLGARLAGGDLASANAAFIFMYAVGMLVGPAAAGAGLDAWNPHGMPLVIAAFLGAYVVLAATRILARSESDR
ncbi:MFS transporter [Methylobrevis albus]|uniref:MFS transporter n=1 Tax=Methylobrevis albus TaxID=2793297 RepID=A0A931I4L8_9HYPH|nr:MFS transporter [Methylobrevis albus]MBH0239193.1 MFS transporter [Methylobrevis albus]